ncbi:MAG: hypothetical protein ABJL44_05000 [Algibacter sp.]
MMRKLFLIPLILLFGCDSETSIQNTDFEVGVISGDISYLNLLTDQLLSDNESIKLELKSIGNNPVAIPTGVNTTPTGSSFEFGPLNFGKYELSAEFMDDTLGIKYSTVDTIEVSAVTPTSNLDITLTPKGQTIILGELLNTSNMPITNAETFLYNDSLALQRFKGVEGFIDSGITNKLGRNVFSGHVEGEYYLLGRLIIDNDTLFSKIEGLIPTVVTQSEITTVKSVVLEANFEGGVISGGVSFLDLLTDEVVSDNELIKLELKAIGDNPAIIPDGINASPTGSSFEFRPLNYGEYKLSVEFIDEALSVIYSAVDTVEVSTATPNKNLDITLTAMDQTIILGELLNTSNMPVTNAEVFLYNDSIALQRFRGEGGFIDKGTTNQLGRNIFSGHVEGEYYLLGRLIIGNDTLYSKTEELIPTIINESEITKIMSVIDFN